MYRKFTLIDGSHPLRKVSDDSYVDYSVTYREGGKVLFFNFDLAKKMGLIPKNHGEHISHKLEKIILKTFAIQIINEWDLVNSEKNGGETAIGETTPGKTSNGKKLLINYYPNPCMATRYLQLQHKSKRGITSGDGRSIWNGAIEHNGKTFDISSRGTGATILSPGAQESKTYIKTGDDSHGYASGLADLDEMIGSALLSEIFYRKEIPTERCLAVIGFPDKTSIGVRVAPNLIRPAHIFRYVKMNKFEELKKMYDYFLDRQINNSVWHCDSKGHERYRNSLHYIGKTYGKLAAILEEEYIFSWLAWDGDNLLASGEILDYGSIRQFAAKHSQYRYEDVDRFSTCLPEQRYWARQMVQVFAQAVDMIMTHEKKPLENFAEEDCLETFDVYYEKEKDFQILNRIGFTKSQIEKITSNHEHRKVLKEFKSSFVFFEDQKTTAGKEKLPDGYTVPPVFIMRNLLRELPHLLLKQNEKSAAALARQSNTAVQSFTKVAEEDFIKLMAASYVTAEDLKLTPHKQEHIHLFQDSYVKLVKVVGRSPKETFKGLCKRSGVINFEHRVTGDGLIWVVNSIMEHVDKLSPNELNMALEKFIHAQVLKPGKFKPLKLYKSKSQSAKTASSPSALLRKISEQLEIYKETV